MAVRTPSDPPEGLGYHADFVAADEERALLAGLDALAYAEVRMHGQVARRQVRYSINFHTLARRASSARADAQAAPR